MSASGDRAERPPLHRMPATDLAKPIRDRSHLTRSEVALLLKLHEAGKTQVEIAQILGCSQPSVHGWLEKFRDTRTEAIYTARSGAQKLVERVLKQANVEESLEVLDRIDVLPKKQRESSGNQLNVIIGMPGQPAGPDPVVIDLSPAKDQ